MIDINWVSFAHTSCYTPINVNPAMQLGGYLQDFCVFVSISNCTFCQNRHALAHVYIPHPQKTVLVRIHSMVEKRSFFGIAIADQG